MPSPKAKETVPRSQPKVCVSLGMRTPEVPRCPAATSRQTKMRPTTMNAYLEPNGRWRTGRSSAMLMLRTGTFQGVGALCVPIGNKVKPIRSGQQVEMTEKNRKSSRGKTAAGRGAKRPKRVALAADRIKETARTLFYREGIRA